MTRSEFIDQYMNAWKAFDSPMQRQCELIADAIGLTDHDVAPVAPSDSELVESMARRIVQLDNARREAENMLEMALNIGRQECKDAWGRGYELGHSSGFEYTRSLVEHSINRALGGK